MPAKCARLPVGYLGNRVDFYYVKGKRVIKITLGFQLIRTPYATIMSSLVMRIFGTRQWDLWLNGIRNGAFSIYA